MGPVSAAGVEVDCLALQYFSAGCVFDQPLLE